MMRDILDDWNPGEDVDRDAQVLEEFRADRAALDKLAVGLSTKSVWDASDLEWVGMVIQSVRPFDGIGIPAPEYLAIFLADTGRDAKELYPEYIEEHS